MLTCDIVHTTSYSTFVETMVYIVPFSSYSDLVVKGLVGRPHSNLAQTFGTRKLNSLGYRAELFA